MKAKVFMRIITDPDTITIDTVRHQFGLWGRKDINIDVLLEKVRSAHVTAVFPYGAKIEKISQGREYQFISWETDNVPDGLVNVPKEHRRHKAPTLLEPSQEAVASNYSGYFEPYPVYLINGQYLVSAEALIPGEA